MMTAVKKMKKMPKMMAFCCRFRLKLNRGPFLVVDRRLLVGRLLVFRVVVFFLLVLLLRVIGQTFLDLAIITWIMYTCRNQFVLDPIGESLPDTSSCHRIDRL